MITNLNEENEENNKDLKNKNNSFVCLLVLWRGFICTRPIKTRLLSKTPAITTNGFINTFFL